LKNKEGGGICGVIEKLDPHDLSKSLTIVKEASLPGTVGTALSDFLGKLRDKKPSVDEPTPRFILE